MKEIIDLFPKDPNKKYTSAKNSSDKEVKCTDYDGVCKVLLQSVNKKLCKKWGKEGCYIPRNYGGIPNA